MKIPQTDKEIEEINNQVIEYVYVKCPKCKEETKHIVVNENKKILCLQCGFYNTTYKGGNKQ